MNRVRLALMKKFKVYLFGSLPEMLRCTNTGFLVSNFIIRRWIDSNLCTWIDSRSRVSKVGIPEADNPNSAAENSRDTHQGRLCSVLPSSPYTTFPILNHYQIFFLVLDITALWNHKYINDLVDIFHETSTHVIWIMTQETVDYFERRVSLESERGVFTKFASISIQVRKSLGLWYQSTSKGSIIMGSAARGYELQADAKDSGTVQ